MEILAPESLQRSEYTQASDVWSVALVICKIISKGKIVNFVVFKLDFKTHIIN